MNKRDKLTLLVGMLVLVAMMPGCGIVNTLRAKDNLNEGVRAFNQGKYEVAQEKFERALSFNPDNTNAQLFHARTLNARFDQAQTEELGLKTLDAYDHIIKNNPDNGQALDQSLAFKAKVYSDLARTAEDKAKAEEYQELRRQALLKRTELPSATDQTKADVHYTLGVGYWETAYALDSPYVTKNQPIPPEVAEKVKPMVQKAHEHLEQAIAIKPDYANAYFYKKLTYLQDNYLDPNPARKKEFVAMANKAQDKYLEIQKQQQAAGSSAQ